MTNTIRVSRKTARLLSALLAAHVIKEQLKPVNPDYHMPSMRLMEIAHIGSGSFYPLIARLEEHGWVKGEWETVPEDANRPRRRFYSLTEQGVVLAQKAVAEDDARWSWWKLRKGKR